jgi:hypothetical protein
MSGVANAFTPIRVLAQPDARRKIHRNEQHQHRD